MNRSTERLQQWFKKIKKSGGMEVLSRENDAGEKWKRRMCDFKQFLC